MEYQQEMAAKAAQEPAKVSETPRKARRKGDREDESEERGPNEYDYNDDFLAPDDEGDDITSPEDRFVFQPVHGIQIPAPQNPIQQRTSNGSSSMAVRDRSLPRSSVQSAIVVEDQEVQYIDDDDDERESLSRSQQIEDDALLAAATQKLQDVIDNVSEADRPDVAEVIECLRELSKGGLDAPARLISQLIEKCPDLLDSNDEFINTLIEIGCGPVSTPATEPAIRPATSLDDSLNESSRNAKRKRVDSPINGYQDDEEYELPSFGNKRRKESDNAKVPSFSRGGGFDALVSVDSSAREKEKAARLYQEKSLPAAEASQQSAVSVDDSFSQPTEIIGEAYRGGPPVSFSKFFAEKLKDHQKVAVKFLWARAIASSREGTGCILADCMGLGKSLSALAVAKAFLDAEHSWPNLPRKGRKVLIACPTSLVRNWFDELKLWWGAKPSVIERCVSTSAME